MNRKIVLARWLAPVLGLMFVLTFAVVLPGCGGSSKKQLGQACQGTTECEDGFECRGKKCKTPLENTPPKAIANVSPTEVEVGQKVTLDGSTSSDPENNPLDFTWVLLEKPDGSKATITDPNSESAFFVPDVAGDYKVQLEVTDRTNDPKKSVAITVRAKQGENSPPVAKAGEDQTVDPGAPVTLDGSKSNDPDGDKLTFQWKFVTKPAGSKATLEKPDTDKPTFTADLVGKYVLELEVADEQKASNTDTISVEAVLGRTEVPAIASVTPDKGTIETTINVKITGEKFVEGLTLTLGNKPYAVKYVSDKELTARLDLTGQTPGDAELYVTNPNNKSSNKYKFVVLDIPTPELSKLEPEFSFEGVKEVKITVTGKNFVSTSEVLFGATPLPTTYKSDTTLEATLNLSNTSKGEYDISVRSPGGRQAATKLKFEVKEPRPAPILRVLNPPTGKAGEVIDFSVHGTGFEAGAVIVFDGKPIPSKRIRRDEIQADPKLDLTNITPDKTYDVWVQNPDGKISAKLKFNVIGGNPTPKIDRILPFSIYIGAVTKIAVYGQGFDKATSKFFIDGKEYTIDRNRSSDTYLESTIDATKGTWKVGDFNAWVVNPGKTPAADKKSNNFKLTITHPTPSIDALTPSGWNISCDADVEITGRNFVKASKLYFGSTVYSATPTNPEFKLTYVSDTKMTFKLLKKNISLTTYKVYLENGPGAKSSTIDFPVQNSSNLPVIAGLQPAAGAADTKISVVVQDNFSAGRFLPGAVVYFNGKKMPTGCRLSFDKTYCYDLTAEIDLNGVKPGNHNVTVSNPCGKTSAPLTFIVSEPPDVYISQILPSYAKVGDKSAITIKGVNLSKGAIVLYGASQLAISYKSDTEIVTTRVLNFGAATKVDIYVDNRNGKKTSKVPFNVIPAAQKLYITQLSSHVLKRGEAHKNVLVQGAGFTANTKIYFNDKVVAATYNTGGQMTITTLDFKSIAAGSYTLYAQEGTVKSNAVTLLAEPLPPPTIRYLSPASRQIGKYTTTYLYIYGNLFCAGTTRCTANPTVKITGPDGKDYTNKLTVSYAYATYVRGEFNLQGIPAGAYKFVVSLPTGEKSGPGVFQLTPPPPPTASSVSPSLAFRGNDQQQISVIGANFVTGDLIIFNNKILNRIPGTANSAGNSINATINISGIKYAGKFPVYVLRCKNTNCTVTEKTTPVFINVQDPPCAPLGVTCATDMKPAGSEACATINSQKVCRPKCTTATQCKALDGAPTNATCTGGFCQ